MMNRCVCALAQEVIVRLPLYHYRPEWSSRKENTFMNQDIPYKPVFPVRTAVKGLLGKPCDKVLFFSQNHLSGRPVLNFGERPTLLSSFILTDLFT